MQHLKTVELIAEPTTPTTAQPESNGAQPAAKKLNLRRNALQRFRKSIDNQILGALEAETENCKEPEQYSGFFGNGSNEQVVMGIRKALKDWEESVKDSKAQGSRVEGDPKKDPKGQGEEENKNQNRS